MAERDPYGESVRPRRQSQLPSYLLDYEVRYSPKHRHPYDEQVRRTTSPEVLHYIDDMRRQHDQLRHGVQRLTEVIARSPVLAPQHTMSALRLNEGETPSTAVHTSKLVPIGRQEDPHQHERAPKTAVRDKSPHPLDSQHDVIEELTNSLRGAGLHNQGAAQTPTTSGESSPQSQYLPSTKGETIASTRHSAGERESH